MIDNLFSIKIYHAIAPHDIKQLINQEIEKSLESCIDNLQYSWGDNVKTTFRYSKEFIKNTPSLEDFIKSSIMEYLSNLPVSYTTINIIESWAAYSEPGGYQNYHTHLREPIISGVYYYQTSIADGDIVFKTDSGGINHSVLNMQKVALYKPEVGKIILFPSFLEHQVTRNCTDNTRISIAFNCVIN